MSASDGIGIRPAFALVLCYLHSYTEAVVFALEWAAEARNDSPQLTGEWSADDYVDAYRYYYAVDDGG